MYVFKKGSLIALIICGLPLVATAQSATETQPSPSEAAVVQSAIANRPTYDASTQTMTMADGTRIPIDELAPSGNQATANQLMNVNRYNIVSATQNAQARQETSTNVDGQAYRSLTSVTVKSQPYAAQNNANSKPVLTMAQATPDPRGAPGVIGLTPNLYFSGTRPFVVVSVTLTGAYGPASVDYEVSGATVSGKYFGRVSGVISWRSGETGTKSFTIPLDVAALAKDRVTSGEIDFALSGGSGALLNGAETGRVVIDAPQPGQMMLPPNCATAGGLPCNPSSTATQAGSIGQPGTTAACVTAAGQACATHQAPGDRPDRYWH